MYEKLRVTAVLKTPIIIRGFLTFDALMGALHFEKYEDVEKAHANIPIKCNEGLFHASAAQVDDFQRGSISFIAGMRADHDIDADLLKKNRDETKNHIVILRTKRERFGNVKNDYPTIAASKVFWDVEGHYDDIASLLKNAMFIGKKRTAGYGEIDRWDFEDGHNDGVLSADGKPLRPIPVPLYKGDTTLPIVDAAWKPAYWDPENRAACYAPEAIT